MARPQARTSGTGGHDSFAASDVDAPKEAQAPAQPCYPLVENILTGKDIYSDPLFYELARTRMPQTRELLQRWYPPQAWAPGMGSPMELVETSLGERYLPLLLDPGVACRVNELIELARPLLARDPTLPPHLLREEFGRHLGTALVWRGMRLDPAVADDLRSRTKVVSRRLELDQPLDWLHRRAEATARGICLSLFTGLTEGPPLQPPSEPSPLGMADHIGAHCSGAMARSFLTSFSDYIEPAHLGGVLRSPNGGPAPISWTFSGNKFYLLRYEIPELSIVRMTGALGGLLTTRIPATVIHTMHMGREAARPRGAPGTEVFVFMQAPAKVVECYPYQDMPVCWILGQ